MDGLPINLYKIFVNQQSTNTHCGSHSPVPPTVKKRICSGFMKGLSIFKFHCSWDHKSMENTYTQLQMLYLCMEYLPTWGEKWPHEQQEMYVLIPVPGSIRDMLWLFFSRHLLLLSNWGGECLEWDLTIWSTRFNRVSGCSWRKGKSSAFGGGKRFATRQRLATTTAKMTSTKDNNDDDYYCCLPEPATHHFKQYSWVVVPKNVCFLTPEAWGRFPFWRAYFSNWVGSTTTEMN